MSPATVAETSPPLAEAAERRRLRAAPGWLMAMAGGALAALAHPPFGVWPGIFGFALMLRALDTASVHKPLRSAFARGWAAGFAYLLISTWWIGEAFFVDPARVWEAPFAVMLTPLGIGLFWGAAGAVYRRVAPAHFGRVLWFAAVLAGFEWLRGHVLTGFPWDLPGEVWRAGSAPSQAAAVLGAYGLSAVVVAIGAAPSVLWDRARLSKKALVPLAAVAALATLWIYGATRLAGAHQHDTALRIRVVQPDLEEAVSYTPEEFTRRFTRYLRLTGAPSARRPDVVVWPEGALPGALNDYLAPGAWPRAALARVLGPGEALVLGGYRVSQTGVESRDFNSLAVLRQQDGDLTLLATYDKYRLVPFGEFLPFPGVLKPLGLKKLVSVGEGFTAGPPPAPITAAGLPRVQPLICYESLYPGFTSDKGGRPSWIVNISNDSWFGKTSGPWQHLNLASYRAIEEGLPLVRATPTGVSAIVDAYGRPRALLGLGRQGVLEGQLPAALAPTLYARWRELPFVLLLAIGAAFADWRSLRPGRTGSARETPSN